MGQRRGLKISFFWGIKNENLKTHVTIKKAGRKKMTIIPGIVGFYFVKQR